MCSPTFIENDISMILSTDHPIPNNTAKIDPADEPANSCMFCNLSSPMYLRIPSNAKYPIPPGPSMRYFFIRSYSIELRKILTKKREFNCVDNGVR